MVGKSGQKNKVWMGKYVVVDLCLFWNCFPKVKILLHEIYIIHVKYSIRWWAVEHQKKQGKKKIIHVIDSLPLENKEIK